MKMDPSVYLNYFRFICLFFSVFFLSSPGMFVLLTCFSTIAYSTLVPLLPQSSQGIIIHRCISHVPSIILLIFTAYYDSAYRILFIILCTFQYFSIWITMYHEVLTKEHRAQILSKGPILFADEFCWALHDAFLTTHILALNSYFTPIGVIKSACNFFMAGLFARNLLDAMNLIFNITELVELEPKKNN